MIPQQVLAECRTKAKERLDDSKPQYKFTAIIVIFVWILAILLVGLLIMKAIRR